VTFGTLATDLALIDPTPDDGPLIQFNGVDADVIKARVADGALDLVSINFMLTGTGVGPAGAGASSPSISRDGSRVAFESRVACSNSDARSCHPGGRRPSSAPAWRPCRI